MSVPFKPTGDLLLVKVLPRDLTAGGLAIPAGADVGPAKGEVIAVGPGRATDFGCYVEQEFYVGQTVYLMDGQPAAQVMLDGMDYLLMRPRDVVGTVPALGEEEEDV